MTSPAASTLSEDELTVVVQAAGAPAFRAAQLRTALWQPFIADLDQISQLPAALRAELATRLTFSAVRLLEEGEADGGMTVKLLCQLGDGQTVETVAMETSARGRSRRRATICVSSQVGCAVGCPFCATGQMGLRRNCTAGEIVDQVRAASGVLFRRGLGPVTHVVYMGMGEPLANYDATLESLHILTRDAGLSARRLTVSTSGIVPAIHRLAEADLPVTLAISLHAATNELRDKLVPINRAYPLEDLVDAGIRFATITGRRLTLEWCLIGGVNDSLEQADGLREIARRAQAHVNVIPMNHIDGSPWGPPSPEDEKRFLDRLDTAHTTIRDTRGSSTDAACGQLRANLERRRMLQPDGTLGPPRRSN